MYIIDKFFKKKKKEHIYSIGDYLILKYLDNTYAVYNKKGRFFVGKDLNEWFSPELIYKHCRTKSLDKAVNILYKVADKGEPLDSIINP